VKGKLANSVGSQNYRTQLRFLTASVSKTSPDSNAGRLQLKCDGTR